MLTLPTIQKIDKVNYKKLRNIVLLVCNTFEVTFFPHLRGIFEFFYQRDPLNCCDVYRDYILISNFTVMTLIPFLLLSLFNYLLFKTIRQSGRVNQKTSLRQKRDQKIAAILILLVAVFASCNFVRIVTNVYEVNKTV